MKDIQIVNIDYSAVDPKYRRKEKHVIAKIPAPWLVPDEGPFYTQGIRLLNGGTPLIYEKDFEYATPAADITEQLGRDIYHHIKLKEHILTTATAIDIEYQTVGDPIIGRNKLLQLLEDMIIKGEPIDITTSVIGMPDTFFPSKHSMDVTKPDEVVGFGNLIQLFSILGSRVEAGSGQIKELLNKLNEDAFKKLDYVQNLQWNAIMRHATKDRNPHLIKAPDVQLSNLSNFATANLQQEVEGVRSDLYSTPRGLGEIVKEAEPDASEFVFQNELPFSYYGSGIYLPPPISGSFEGLGGDQETGCFIQEGNGWLVGLLRAFDGKVRNLFYIYDTQLTDDPRQGFWRQSYVQYKHPAITAAGCDANYVISGSGDRVLMLGDNTKSRWWICDPNSTLDAAAHNFKEVDTSAMHARPNWSFNFWHQGNVFRVGDWLYFLMFTPEINLFPGDYKGAVSGDNMIGWLYRAPASDLTNPAKTNIKFEPCTINYDNLRRERRNSQAAFSMDRFEVDGNNLITSGGGCQYSIPVNSFMSHRRRNVIVVENPNNPNQARIRFYALVRPTYNDGGLTVQQSQMTVDYLFDNNTLTLALDPKWKYMYYDLRQNWITNLTEEELRRQWVPWGGGAKGNLPGTGTAIPVSYVPGFGHIGILTGSDGGMPYIVCKVLNNPSRDPRRDWEYFAQPNSWRDASGRMNDGNQYIQPDTPFGFTSFPRWYSDLYDVNGQILTTPIELFIADNPGVDGQHYYREVEPGTGTQYIPRPEAKLMDGTIPYAREMNSKFGPVTNRLPCSLGRVNNPKSKDQYSTEYGIFTVTWPNYRVAKTPLFSPVVVSKDTYAPPTMDSEGSIVIPLLLDHTIVNGKMTLSPNPSKSVHIPAYIWRDWMHRLIGAEMDNVIDIVVDFFISPKQDGLAYKRHSYAMFTFHTTDNPKAIRQIISKFTWAVRSYNSQGVRIMQVSSEQYPFVSSVGSQPYSLAPGVDNTLIDAGWNDAQFNPNGTWKILNVPSQLSTPNMQVLEHRELGEGVYEIFAYTGWRIFTQSYSRIFGFKDYNNPHKPKETFAFSPYTGAFVSYATYGVANPEHGMCTGENYLTVGGGAVDMTISEVGAKKVMRGATFSVGNWSVFIASDIVVSFGGYSMTAVKRNFDLRNFTSKFRNNTFYIYCVARGSKAEYEVSGMLRYPRSDSLLVAKIITGDLGVESIERYQPFAIAGFPLTRVRDAGIPVSSGSIFDEGTYSFIKYSELYTD
ncbi:hypothetical protein PQC07_gp156 [Aeromonas phage D3]|uniref:Uncharacterized protein n=1 Tax=Aeromonas phage D3 TaxID=2593327 RepID=A0A514TVR7_9CAUD|nr:hypothetical protein PQC07_gp156 [Aeromonas phage D3]QDJ97117.1 hypothetical protein D3_0119 [Aeromonas phage D3]